MTNLFSADTYRKRRQELKRRMGSGVLLFLGNEQSPMNYGANHYPFRQDSTFLYFFGLDKPGLAATINVDEDTETLFGEELTMDDIVWEGPHPTLVELASLVGITQVLSPDKLASNLAGDVHYLPPYRPENKIRLSQLLGQTPDWVELNASLALVKAIVPIRSIKEQQEIQQLHQAVTITSEMHLAAMQLARPGMKESEIVGKLLNIASAQGNFYSFPPIVTINGQTLHNHFYGNTLEEGRLLICDSGGETSMHYSGDMTRAWPVSGKFSERQRAVYEIVLEALKSCAGEAKPGVLNLNLHKRAAAVIFDGLKALGLTHGDTPEAVEAGAHALFFPHGLGHMMGLDVHDMEDYGEDHVGYTQELGRSKLFGYNALRLGRGLEAGFVITIEPGIYFIPELVAQWKASKQWESFLNFVEIEKFLDFGGIRLENDYHITENGAELLGKPLPLEIDEVEEARSVAVNR